MTTSGTVGLTTINVQKLIDHGARRCGKLAEELTSEQQLSARESLFYLLSNLVNIGIQYWAVEKTIIGLRANKTIYELPLGAVDALNTLYRQTNRPDGGYSASSGVAANAFDNDVTTICQQTAPDGNIAINYSSDTYIGTIGVLPGTSGSFNVVYEYSTDGVTWSTLYAPGAQTWVDNEWIWVDLDQAQSVQYYRMRETGGNTLAVREFFLGNNTRDIQMSRLNRDDYTNLPNKEFTANQPFQFWFNRTIAKPTLYLWPVPNNDFVQVVCWYSRQIEDVGALQNELEIPQRWYLAIQSMLAHQMAMELPNVQLDRIAMLKAEADQRFVEAEQEERDKSPIFWAPDISVYSR